MFVLSLIFAVVAVIALATAIASKDSDVRVTSGIVTLVVAALSLSAFLWSATVQVSTKNVGVVTTFGKPAGQLSAGLHWIAPWKHVTEFPATIQSDAYIQGQKGSDCISARIANSSVACVDTTVQWRIKENAVDGLYQDYKTFEHVRDILVSKQLTNAINVTFSTYNPLASFNSQGVSTVSLPDLANQVKAKLVDAVGDRVEILTVLIPLIHHDDTTQAKINAYQAALADTRIAVQKQQIALADAKSNEILRESLNNDPGVLINKCLDVVKSGVALPAGFNCNLNGSGSTVVVPATK